MHTSRQGNKMADADEMNMLPQQKALAGMLERGGRDLHRLDTVEPRKVTEVAILALATLRTWLGPAVLRRALQEVGWDEMDTWETELAAGEAHLARLRACIQEELHLSLRDRNRRRPDLAPRIRERILRRRSVSA